MVFDILKPYYYKLEKGVASKGIPAVHELPNRQTLATAPKEGAVFDHSVWNEVLGQYVDTTGTTINQVNGVNTVNYDGIAADTRFRTYLGQLESADPSSLSGPEQLAFWMNAYNALCINLIIQNKPNKSINELSANGQAVWDKAAGKVAHKDVSLNHIEHEQLRAKWKEPAVHGCIVCASASCPNLRPEAYVGSKVEDQMTSQMKNWMANDTKGAKLLKSSGWIPGKRVELSRIFLWFGDDFGGWEGIRTWLPQFIEDQELKEAIESPRVAVRYFEYDWTLNRKKKD